MSRFISNLFKLTTGTMLAQIIGIALIPVVTRLYPPDFFGVAQLFLSIAALIVVISSLTYDSVIMLPEKDEDSMNVFALSLLIALGISTVAGAILIGFADWFGELLNTPMIADYLIWLPIYVFANSLFFALNAWLSRKEQYGLLSHGIIMRSVSMKVFQIGGGLITATPLGLILGPVLGLALADIFMLRGLKEDITLLKSVAMDRIKSLAVRYKSFSYYGSTGILANSISWEMPAFMLAYFFNPTILGYYALATMAVRLPMTMVGTAIAQVFFQQASLEKNKTGDIQNAVREIHTRLISIGIFPFVIFIILAEDLFTFAFGAEWLTAGTFARILAPWFFAVFIISPINSLFGVLEKQRAYFMFEIATLCAWAIIFSIGGMLGDPIITLTLFSLGGVLLWGSKSVFLTRASGAGCRDSMQSLAKSLLISIVISIPLMLGVFADISFILLLVLAGISAVAFYLLIIFTDTLVRREFLEMIEGYIPLEYVEWAKRL
ncbi:MAG: oligosaccharide flippase family protein [Methanomicrobiaceae archaeon]|nr:oligosaccharide flippase family protein [Methanomicrobiaceae archaeon]